MRLMTFEKEKTWDLFISPLLCEIQEDSLYKLERLSSPDTSGTLILTFQSQYCEK
jgi:hypothetical protein